jgi:hypothetical protein
MIVCVVVDFFFGLVLFCFVFLSLITCQRPFLQLGAAVVASFVSLSHHMCVCLILLFIYLVFIFVISLYLYVCPILMFVCHFLGNYMSIIFLLDQGK